ncbi:neuronal acetylcholine receptor subunit alpha-5-like [Aplysia californica]|uniref:Neuronal acetylcholine receptor subunit alpha-5-like n=1 Tax=Aplysia californica TaxID=6500 RepID=A0ABM1A6R9_APLCA|nr:neuronal acetylcholine receptor subunit alpha-5-like [Aplysia californica]
MRNSTLWNPFIYFGNGARKNFVLKAPDIVEVRHTGEVRTLQSLQMVTSCFLDLTYFPSDTQNCSVILQALNNGEQIIIHSMSSNFSSFDIETNTEWTLESSCESMIRWDNGFQNDSKFIVFYFFLRRRSTFYIVNIVMPIALTSLMSLVVFLIPPSSGEKISFLVALFVSLTVFLMLVSNMLPRSLNEVPKLNTFVVIAMTKCFLVLIATVVVLRRYHWEQERGVAKNPTRRRAHKISQTDQLSSMPDERRFWRSGIYTLTTTTAYGTKEDKTTQTRQRSRRKVKRGKEAEEVDDCESGVEGGPPTKEHDDTDEKKSWFSSSRLDFLFLVVFLCISIPLYVSLFWSI